MERQWEEFQNGPVVRENERIHVTINRRGNLYLNRRAFEALGKPDQVVLLYDRRNAAIGVRASAPGRENAFRLSLKDKKGTRNRVIYTANFCRFYGIRPTETLSFTTAEVDGRGILVLELRKVVPALRMRP